MVDKIKTGVNRLLLVLLVKQKFTKYLSENLENTTELDRERLSILFE